jgi:hypothetical protein
LDQRYYNSNAARFYTPDPKGMRAAKLSNPTSWNMYAYVNGDPVNFNDPRGRDLCTTDSGCGPTLGYGGFTPENGETYSGWASSTYFTDIALGMMGDLATDVSNLLGGGTGDGGVLASFSTTVFASDPSPVPSPVSTSLDDTSMPTDDSSSTPAANDPWGGTLTLGDPAGYGAAAPNNGTTPIGTPKTPAQCSIYQDGSATGTALYTLCSSVFPNGPVSNQIRGCLQSLYTPGSGYAPIPAIVSTTPGSLVDINRIIPGTGAHLACFANAAGLL